MIGILFYESWRVEVRANTPEGHLQQFQPPISPQPSMITEYQWAGIKLMHQDWEAHA